MAPTKDEFGNPIVNFGALPPLPSGWYVVQLDSGHYIATNGEQESPITVYKFVARKWAISLAAVDK